MLYDRILCGDINRGVYVIPELMIIAAMGGVQPEGATAMATRACGRRMAQLAASYKALDVQARVVGETVVLPEGRYLVQLQVTIRYRRETDIETRQSQVGCIVNEYGRVETIMEPE